MKHLKFLVLICGMLFQTLSLQAAETTTKTFSAYSTIPTRSMDLPQYLTQYFNKNQLQQVVEELNNIRVLTPEQFFVYLRNNLTTVLSASDHAVVFKTDLKVTKVSLFGMLNDPFWNLLLKGLPTDVQESYVLRASHDPTLIQREIIGQILWRTYDPLTSPVWMASSDLQALYRDYEYGRSLKEVLAQPELYAQFDSKELWKEVVRLQNLAEKMLLEVGLSVDLRSPSNFILMGDKSSLRLSNIDYELVLPNQATRSYYLDQGRRLPRVRPPGLSHRVVPSPNSGGLVRPVTTSTTSSMDLDLRVTEALLVPTEILNHPQWNLTHEQAKDYLQARYGVTEARAIEMLLEIPRYKNKNALRLKRGRCVSFFK